MSLHRKMIILRLLHPRHIVQPIHQIHRRMYLRDRTVLSVCSRQIRCRNSLLLFGKPPQYHCLNIFPMVSNQEFEHCQYSHHYSFHYSRQEQKSLSKLSENRIKFSYSFFDTSYEFKFSSLQTEIYFFLVVIRSNKHPIKNPTRVPQVFIITSSNCANLPINVCKNSIPIENTAPSITPFHQCLWIFLKINTGKNPYGMNRHIFKIVAALNPSSNNLKLI